MLDRVLMVCAANICRSPIAEGLLRSRFAARGKGRVESAGLAALEGRAAAPLSQELMKERGIDISGHRARQLTPELLASFELILVMEERHQREIESLSRAARGRVHRIGRFGGYDVADPYGGSREDYERAVALIERGIEEFDRAFWSRA